MTLEPGTPPEDFLFYLHSAGGVESVRGVGT